MGKSRWEEKIYREEYLKEKARVDVNKEQNKKSKSNTLSFYNLIIPIVLLGFVGYFFIAFGESWFGVSIADLLDYQTLAIFGGLFFLFIYFYYFE